MADQSHSEYSPFGILKKERDRFDSDSNVENPTSYITYRGLRERARPPNGQFVEKSYLEVLPTFEEKDFLQLVNDRVREGKTTKNSQNGIRIVDIGYGKGIFLLDCRKEWKDQVQIVGYGTDKYTKTQALSAKTRGIISERTDTDLAKADIKLIEGNVVDVRKKLGDNYADIIVSIYALMYVEYPAWELVKKLYRVLKPGGIALLDFYPVALNLFQPVLEYLEDRGYSFEETDRGLAFKKTHPDIDVPIRTTNWGKNSMKLEISSAK